MKNLLLLCLVTMLAFCSCTSEEHFDFMGISMGLPYEEFAKELKKQGCIYVKTQDYNGEQIFYYKGKFAGVDDCFIQVVSNNKEYINYVCVSFPNEYATDEALFDNLKESLIKKYGDINKEINLDGYGYMCKWVVDKGVIVIGDSPLMIMYSDKKNNESGKEKEQRIIYNDL